MGFGFGIDPRDVLRRNIVAGVEKYQRENSLKTRFGEPILGFARANHPLFDIFFGRDELIHPKGVYRPGNTVIVHFLPFQHPLSTLAPHDPEARQRWETAMKESIMLSMGINGIIRDTMSAAGHMVSGTTTPADWNPIKLAPEWNHKLAAYICGIGHISFGDSLLTSSGAAGRFGSAITDFVMEPSRKWSEEEIDVIRRDPDFYRRQAFGLEGVPRDRIDELMLLCPAEAVTTKGMERNKCQDYCRTLDMAAPSQDACGRCWPLGILDRQE